MTARKPAKRHPRTAAVRRAMPPRGESSRWRVERVQLREEHDLQELSISGEWRIIDQATGVCAASFPFDSQYGALPGFTESGPLSVYMSAENEAVVWTSRNHWKVIQLAAPGGRPTRG
jgi:hypothetical protein